MVAPVAGMGKPMGVLPSPERRRHMEHWATGSRPFLPPKGAAVVMFQEVSFHPEERRRVKGILKKIGSDY